MFLEYFRTRVSSQRCPPQLGFQTALVALVGDMTHVFVATGEKLIGVPVAFGNLVAIIYIHPFEA